MPSQDPQDPRICPGPESAQSQDALAIRMQVLPKDHPDIATSINNLATTYYNLKRYEDALTLHQKALAIREQVLPTTKT